MHTINPLFTISYQRNHRKKYSEIGKGLCFRSSGTKEDVPGIICVSSVKKKGKKFNVFISENKRNSFQKCLSKKDEMALMIPVD